MTAHYRWETTLDERRRADPGIDDPARSGERQSINGLILWQKVSFEKLTPEPCLQAPWVL